MRAHRRSCEWFGVWSAVGFGLVLAFVGIFSVGAFLLPVVTLLLGVATCRGRVPGRIAAGLVVAVAGIACGLEISVWAFLATPLVTLAVGLAPALPRGVAGMLRVGTIGAIVAACAVAAVSASPAPDTVLAVAPLALVAFALAAAGRLDVEITGAIAGAGVAGVLLGGPPACLLLIAAGLAAFPLLRASAGPRPLPR
ncbi:MAG TPA: hypothetical protein VGL44_08310 [Gaiellales bacterium]